MKPISASCIDMAPRKDDVEDTMAAFSELIANLGWEPISVIPIRDPYTDGLAYVTVDQTPGPDRAFAVDKQTGVEATLSECDGIWQLELRMAWRELPTAPRPLAEAFAEPLREVIRRLRNR
jgi:hypothetical protein